MSNRKLDLVLKCVVIATELLKFANELVAFLNTVLNYPMHQWSRNGRQNLN
jgi:hypothetical protein